MRVVLLLLIIWVLLLITGCQANPVDASVPSEAAASPTTESLSTSLPVLPTQGESQMTPSLLTPVNPGLQSLIEKVKEDLIQRLSVSANEIILVEASEVEWSDSGLGCPQPGMDYLQVITPGYLILLEVNAQIYEYHSNRDTYFVYCENSNSPLFPKP